MTTHFNLTPRPRIVELYLHFPHVFMTWCSIKHRNRFTFTEVISYSISKDCLLKYEYGQKIENVPSGRHVGFSKVLRN
jgi:hypothetical protein